MRKVFTASLFITLALGVVPAMAKDEICLDIHDIASQYVEGNGQSVVLRMRDGKIWRNTFNGACHDLVFSGYRWAARNSSSRICGEDAIRVLQSGEICQLGRFESSWGLPDARYAQPTPVEK